MERSVFVEVPAGSECLSFVVMMNPFMKSSLKLADGSVHATANHQFLTYISWRESLTYCISLIFPQYTNELQMCPAESRFECYLKSIDRTPVRRKQGHKNSLTSAFHLNHLCSQEQLIPLGLAPLPHHFLSFIEKRQFPVNWCF